MSTDVCVRSQWSTVSCRNVKIDTVSIVTFDTRQQQDGDLKISVLRVVY
jgi:hypothetical protein